MRNPVSPDPLPLVERIREDLLSLRHEYLKMLEASRLRCLEQDIAGNWKEVRCDDGQCTHTMEWAPDPPAGVVERMLLHSRVVELSRTHHSIYPTRMTEVLGLLGYYDGLSNHLNRNLARMSGGRGFPQDYTNEAFASLVKSLEYLPGEDVTTRLVLDTTSLMDNPDLARYKDTIGNAYLVHLVPEVLHEVDRLKDQGPPKKSELARKVDTRLKGYRDSADVRTGATVEGDISVVFDFREP